MTLCGPRLVAETQEAALLLGNIHRQQRLAPGAQVGALGDVAQPVEIQVGAAVDGHVALARGVLAGRVALGARHRERAGRLEHRARILEHVLDGAADLVGIDAQHLIDVLARQREAALAHGAHGDAVGEQADALERHALPGAQRFVHGGRVDRLDTDDAHAWMERLDVGGDAGDQAAAADRHEDRVHGAAGLADDLHADRALPGDHVVVIEGMHEAQLLLLRQQQRVLEGGVEHIAVQDHARTPVGDRLHLDRGRGQRHDHHGADPASLRRQRHALRMVAGGGRDHAARRRLGVEVCDLVEGAAQLEGKHRLQVFALEPQLIAESARQARSLLERRFDRDLVDTGLQDALQVILAHGAKLKASARRQ